MKFPCFLLTLSLAAALSSSLHAGTTRETTQYVTYDPPAPAPRSCFEKGRWSSELLFEGYVSFAFSSRARRTDVDYYQGSYRIGRMMSDLKGDGFWRGNYQILAEGLYAGISEGPGGWISGANIFVRRNFVTPNEKLSWYAQLGAGVVWSDMYKERVQTMIGRSREFSLVGGVGLRYEFRKDWFFLIEANYRHISNADTAPRNTGLDSVGGGIGAAHSF